MENETEASVKESTASKYKQLSDSFSIQDIKGFLGANPDVGYHDPVPEFLFEKFNSLDFENAKNILVSVVRDHDDDVNFPEDVMKYIKLILIGPEAVGLSKESWEIEARKEAALIYFHSPYPEVRAVTDPFDDPETPVETFRAYFWGILWSIIGSGMNQFFSPRQPSIWLCSGIMQILLFPCGRMSEHLPDWGLTINGKRHSLNPGPWSGKEQMFATLIVNVSINGAYASLYNIMVDRLPMYYNNSWANIGYQCLLIFSTQFMGVGFAGIMRRLVVYPVRAVWPTVLSTLALNKAFTGKESTQNINGWKISRYQFFLWVFSISFVYFWIPGYLFQATSYFNWITWLKPTNYNLAAITGSIGGLGLNPFPTFDWTVINYKKPLNIPFYSMLNQYLGALIAGAVIIPAIFYSNKSWTSYFPINNNHIYTNTGKKYDVSQVLTRGVLDKNKYESYGPPFYTAANLVCYGAYFALYPFAIIYTFGSEWKTIKLHFQQIWQTLKHPRRSNFKTYGDIHCQMMSEYKEVPDWWFFITLLISLMLGIILVLVYPEAHTPVWGIFFAIGMNFLFLIPISLICSVTGFTFQLNVLIEIIVGYALPGKGIALNILKCYGANIGGQAENYITDQKIAHYAKVPPQALFRGQIISLIIQCFVAIGIVNWQISNVKGLCTSHQAQKFVCPPTNTFFSASVTWGVIGPKKIFSGMYPALQWYFLIGALAAIPCLALKKFFPKQTKYFQPTLIIGGMLIFAPYNLSYLTVGLYVSFIFMYYLKKRYQAWWEKYNYVLSASLTAGCAFSAVIIFFSVQYSAKDLDWWGNKVSYAGVDNHMHGRLPIPDNLGYVGPSPGNYP